MLKSISIKNFQAHKDSFIEFSDGLNIITAEKSGSSGSDIGKTSILRAINWITNGKPAGFDFHSNWCGHGSKTEVTIEFDDCVVSRWKSKSKNQWNFDGLELNATGKDVPLEVAEKINWGELNYQSQHDGAFLLSETDGKIAKKLNELVNLDIIDKTIGNITSRVKATNKNIDVKKEHVESIDGQTEKYDMLDEAKKEYDKLCIMETRYFDSDDRYRDLADSLKSIKETESELEEFGDIDECLRDLVSIFDALSSREVLSTSTSLLSNGLSSVISTHNELKGYRDVDSAIVGVEDCISMLRDKESKKMNLVSLNGQALIIEDIEKELTNFSYLGDACSEVEKYILVCESIKEKKESFCLLDAHIITVEDIEKELAGFSCLEDAHSEVETLIEWIGKSNEKKTIKQNLERKTSEIKSMVADIKSKKNGLDLLEVEFKEAMGDSCPLCESKL